MIRSLGLLISLCLPLMAVTKVAVIGDSISTGAAAKNPKLNGYPARMGHLLGEEYEVQAFAMGGHTLLRKTPAALMNKPIYQLPWKTSFAKRTKNVAATHDPAAAPSRDPRHPVSPLAGWRNPSPYHQ